MSSAAWNPEPVKVIPLRRGQIPDRQWRVCNMRSNHHPGSHGVLSRMLGASRASAIGAIGNVAGAAKAGGRRLALIYG